MQIRFWGVRGSIPTPLSPTQIQSKITAAIQRITLKDIESVDSKQRFLSSLPSWIFGTIGGNTSCVGYKNSVDTHIIFDAGTGIRGLGKTFDKSVNNEIHLLLSHYHWDHIQGLPFFDPIYWPNTTMHIYSPDESAPFFLREQMKQPFYPVQYDTAFTKNIIYHKIEPGIKFFINSTEISCKKMSHPGSSYSYSVYENGKKFIYATDVELNATDFEKTKENTDFFQNADVLILDSQYTVEEAAEKENWGHSAFCYAIDFASTWNISTLYLYHHEPTYDDRKVHSILQAGQWYSDYIDKGKVSVRLATEDTEIEI